MFDIFLTNPNQNNQIGMKNIQSLYIQSRETQTSIMRGIARKDSLRDNRFLPMQILAVSTQATQNNQIGMKNNKRLYIQSASGPA